jgi:hypothetical protein
MAGNVLTSNPIYIDTAASSDIYNRRVVLIQWQDEAGDVINDEDLSITINGVTFAMKFKLGSDVGQQDIILWEAAFSTPILVTHMVVNVIDDGAVLVWCV